MSHSDTIDLNTAQNSPAQPERKRRAANAVWQPFLQFKLLMYMLGSTAFIAALLAGFLYFAFSDLLSVVIDKTDSTSYYGEMINIQLVHMFRYCGALVVLYILLLASVCVAYTHRLIGPLRPFVKHVEQLTAGNYSSRVALRKGDLEMYNEYAEKLNDLARKLNAEEALKL